MKKHVHKTIANKLFWSLALFFTICFVIVIISMSLLFQNEVDGIRKTETSRVTGYYSENFNKVINEMETICNIIGNNYDIQQMIRKNPPDNKKEYLKERCDINGRLALLVQSYTDVPYEIAFFWMMEEASVMRGILWSGMLKFSRHSGTRIQRSRKEYGLMGVRKKYLIHW